MTAHARPRHRATRTFACTLGILAIPVGMLVLAPSLASAQGIPPGAGAARAALDASPRHAEWATIRVGEDSVRAWVAYPERRDDAPVVLVIHEIFGVTHWIRAIADHLAAHGFLAVAPDLLTMAGVAMVDGEPERDAAVTAVRGLADDVVHRQLRAVAEYAMALPGARESYGVVGFCWGGAAAFAHAARYPDLGASVVYYGGSPEEDALAGIRSPVLGLYAEDDQRVNATIPRAREALDRDLYRVELFEAAGHGFLRQQDGRDGANLDASTWAWPFTVGFLSVHLER